MTTPLTDQELQELRACADAAGLSHELSVLLFKAERNAEACPTCGSDCNERDELIKAEREIERLRAMHAALPRLPTPRLLASGTIAGKRIELHGWHTEDMEVWQRQHGLKFGA
jgi:hypothetical protein